MDWDKYFMSMCYLVALKSKDESTKYGAIIVGPDNEIRSTGYNSFPRDMNDFLSERQERPEKYFYVEHAERNGIYNAARVGTPLKGCRMYIQGLPCADCARAIIQAGINEVIVHKQWMDHMNSELWEDHYKRSIKMFTESKVYIRYYDGKMAEIYACANGEKWNPQ